MLLMVLVPLAIVVPRTAGADAPPDSRFPLFAYLSGHPAASLAAYTPLELDPRQEINQKRLATSSIRADLEALRPAFDLGCPICTGSSSIFWTRNLCSHFWHRTC
jgi:hypothetical protein